VRAFCKVAAKTHTRARTYVPGIMNFTSPVQQVKMLQWIENNRDQVGVLTHAWEAKEKARRAANA